MQNSEFTTHAIENFKSGYSCSESIVAAMCDICCLPKDLINTATPFSGGMGSGCLCGAVAGAQIVIGYYFGKNKTNTARALAKEFVEEFKKANGFTCCKALTANFEFSSPKRRENCLNMVQSAAMILENILTRELNKTSDDVAQV